VNAFSEISKHSGCLVVGFRGLSALVAAPQSVHPPDIGKARWGVFLRTPAAAIVKQVQIVWKGVAVVVAADVIGEHVRDQELGQVGFGDHVVVQLWPSDATGGAVVFVEKPLPLPVFLPFPEKSR
jgi:hypothetical protein